MSYVQSGKQCLKVEVRTDQVCARSAVSLPPVSRGERLLPILYLTTLYLSYFNTPFFSHSLLPSLSPLALPSFPSLILHPSLPLNIRQTDVPKT